MSDLDVARSQMEEIIQWWGVLEDAADSVIGVVGHRLSITGVHGAPTDATVTAILQIDQIDTIVQELQALAAKLGWRSGKDGDPKTYILAHLDWSATADLAPEEWAGVIVNLHRRVGRITGFAPRATQQLCPMCGEALQIIPPDRPTWHTASERREAAKAPDRFTCAGCDVERTSDELETLVKWRASNVPMATTHEAAKLLGVKPGSIRQRALDRGLTPRKVGGRSLYKITDLM